VVERPVDLPESEGWCEPPCAESAQQSFSDLSDGTVGLAVLNQGLAEIGVHRTGDGVAMGLTLLRAVGWIARLHWGVAGYRIPTPEAQCLGAHTFKYALYPHAGDWQEGHVWEQAQRFAVPPIVHDVDASEGEGSALTLVEISPSELVISACKRAEGEDAVIVRLWNAASHEVNGAMRLGFAASEACRVNLAEEPGEALMVEGGVVRLTVKAHEIVTVQVKRAG
jgi:alpha-mannosidase